MLVCTGTYRNCVFRIVKRKHSHAGNTNDPKFYYLDGFIQLPESLDLVHYYQKGYDLRHFYSPRIRTLSFIGALSNFDGIWVGYRAANHESMYTHGLEWAKSECYNLIGLLLDGKYGILSKKQNGQLRFVKPIEDTPVSFPKTMEESDDDDNEDHEI